MSHKQHHKSHHHANTEQQIVTREQVKVAKLELKDCVKKPTRDSVAKSSQMNKEPSKKQKDKEHHTSTEDHRLLRSASTEEHRHLRSASTEGVEECKQEQGSSDKENTTEKGMDSTEVSADKLDIESTDHEQVAVTKETVTLGTEMESEALHSAEMESGKLEGMKHDVEAMYTQVEMPVVGAESPEQTAPLKEAPPRSQPILETLASSMGGLRKNSASEESGKKQQKKEATPGKLTTQKSKPGRVLEKGAQAAQKGKVSAQSVPEKMEADANAGLPNGDISEYHVTTSAIECVNKPRPPAAVDKTVTKESSTKNSVPKAGKKEGSSVAKSGHSNSASTKVVVKNRTPSLSSSGSKSADGIKKLSESRDKDKEKKRHDHSSSQKKREGSHIKEVSAKSSSVSSASSSKDKKSTNSSSHVKEHRSGSSSGRERKDSSHEHRDGKVKIHHQSEHKSSSSSSKNGKTENRHVKPEIGEVSKSGSVAPPSSDHTPSKVGKVEIVRQSSSSSGSKDKHRHDKHRSEKHRHSSSGSSSHKHSSSSSSNSGSHHKKEVPQLSTSSTSTGPTPAKVAKLSVSSGSTSSDKVKSSTTMPPDGATKPHKPVVDIHKQQLQQALQAKAAAAKVKLSFGAMLVTADHTSQHDKPVTSITKPVSPHKTTPSPSQKSLKSSSSSSSHSKHVCSKDCKHQKASSKSKTKPLSSGQSTSKEASTVDSSLTGSSKKRKHNAQNTPKKKKNDQEHGSSVKKIKIDTESALKKDKPPGTPKKVKEVTDKEVKLNDNLKFGTVIQSALDYRLLMLDPKISDLNIKYGNLIHREEDTNGGGVVLHSYQEELNALSPEERSQFAEDFLELLFHEEPEGVCQHVMGIIHNAAANMPELIEYFADAYPQLPVKQGVMGKSDIETTTMGAFRDAIAKSYDCGTFRCGGLNHISVVGTRQEEAGDYFPEFLDAMEKDPFLSRMVPWGSLSAVHGMPRNDSNDGPILWARPGEQMVPSADMPKSPFKRTRRLVSFKNLYAKIITNLFQNIADTNMVWPISEIS